MGFVHYNNTVEEQLSHVTKCKRHIPGFVVTPAVLPPTATLEDIEKLRVGRWGDSAGARAPWAAWGEGVSRRLAWVEGRAPRPRRCRAGAALVGSGERRGLGARRRAVGGARGSVVCALHPRRRQRRRHRRAAPLS